jgi:hypothetical protein
MRVDGIQPLAGIGTGFLFRQFFPQTVLRQIVYIRIYIFDRSIGL